MTAAFDHGRHWYFLAIGGDVQQKLRGMFAQLAGGEAIAFEHQKVLQLVQPEGDLRCSFLLRNEQFVAGYPLVLDGFGWPIRIHDTLTWPDGIQANLMGKCNEFDICLFDTQHFLHKDSYRGGRERTFVVAALAYKLFTTIYDNDDQEFELTGKKAFFPLRPEDGGGVDELKFMSHVEAVRELDFWGVPLLAYTVTLAETEEFPLRLEVFAHPSVCEKRFQVGDPISGFAWLFGAAHGEA